MLKPDSRRGGKLVPLRAAAERGEIVLERPRLEPLTAAQEAEAVELWRRCSQRLPGIAPATLAR